MEMWRSPWHRLSAYVALAVLLATVGTPIVRVRVHPTATHRSARHVVTATMRAASLRPAVVRSVLSVDPGELPDDHDLIDQTVVAARAVRVLPARVPRCVAPPPRGGDSPILRI